MAAIDAPVWWVSQWRRTIVHQLESLTIRDCGHPAHLECAADVRKAIRDFPQRTWADR